MKAYLTCLPRLPDPGQIDEETTFVVQPDITVVCDLSKLSKSGYCGVPKLIIEVTSPTTAKNDKIVKFNRFEKTGVPEYWIVEPEEKIVTVYILQQDGRYGRPEIYVDLNRVFQNI